MSVRILSETGEVIFSFQSDKALLPLLTALIGAKFGCEISSSFAFSPILDDFSQALSKHLQTLPSSSPGGGRFYTPIPISLERSQSLLTFLEFVAAYKDVHFPWDGCPEEEKNNTISRLLVPLRLQESDFPRARAILDSYVENVVEEDPDDV